MPTITQLEYLVAVDRTRHFGRAADECHVSQPTLSAQIQRLEEELAITVFDRKKKPVVPTPEGVGILEQARAVLREYAKLVYLSRDAGSQPAGPFSLAIIPTLAPYVLPLFLSAFSRGHPHVDLSVREMRTDEMIRALRSDQLDAGIAATPLREQGIRERALFYEPFYVYCAAGHSLLAKKTVREAELDPADLWLLEDGHCFRTQVINFCGGGEGHCGTFENVRFESGTLETLRRLVQEGQGYTLLPHLLVARLGKRERERHVRPLVRPVPTREVSLVFRRDLYKVQTQRALFDMIRAHLPEQLPRKKGGSSRVLGIA